MDTEKHVFCPTCGTPLKVHEDANEFYRHYAESLEDDKEQSFWSNLYYEYCSDPSTVENTISKFDSLKCVISGFINTDNEYISRVAHYVVNPRSINYGFVEKSIYGQMTTDDKAMLDAMHISDCTKGFQFYIMGFETMDDVLARYVSDMVRVFGMISCSSKA